MTLLLLFFFFLEFQESFSTVHYLFPKACNNYSQLCGEESAWNRLLLPTRIFLHRQLINAGHYFCFRIVPLPVWFCQERRPSSRTPQRKNWFHFSYRSKRNAFHFDRRTVTDNDNDNPPQTAESSRQNATNISAVEAVPYAPSTTMAEAFRKFHDRYGYTALMFHAGSTVASLLGWWALVHK